MDDGLFMLVFQRMYLADTQEDLQLHVVNIDDENNEGTSRGSRLQSRHNSSAGQASVASSVAFDVSLRAAAELAMLEPGPGQRDPRIDEVRSLSLVLLYFCHDS